MPQLSPSYYWLSTASLQWAKFDLVLLEHPLFTETIASPYTTLSRSLSLLYWIAQSLPNTVTVQHCKIVINIVPEGLWEQCVWSEHHFTTHTLIGVITLPPPILYTIESLLLLFMGWHEWWCLPPFWVMYRTHGSAWYPLFSMIFR